MFDNKLEMIKGYTYIDVKDIKYSLEKVSSFRYEKMMGNDKLLLKWINNEFIFFDDCGNVLQFFDKFKQLYEYEIIQLTQVETNLLRSIKNNSYKNIIGSKPIVNRIRVVLRMIRANEFFTLSEYSSTDSETWSNGYASDNSTDFSKL